jgi:hypothetical protein
MKDQNVTGTNHPQNSHPSGSDLHDFFSKWPGSELSLGSREQIASHVAACVECSHLGEVIQNDEKTIDNVLAKGPTPTAETRLRRSLRWLNKVYMPRLNESVKPTIPSSSASIAVTPPVALAAVESTEDARDMLSLEDTVPKKTKVTLWVFRALALERSDIPEMMMRNFEVRQVTYEYNFIGSSAASQIPRLYSCLSKGGKIELAKKVTFRMTMRFLSDAMEQFLTLFFADGLWIYEFPDGRVERYKVFQLNHAIWGRKLGGRPFTPEDLVLGPHQKRQTIGVDVGSDSLLQMEEIVIP